MPDAQTIYELRLAFQKPSCPVCSLVQRAGARYIESVFSESMLDPNVRQKLVNSRGFCYEHTWLSIHLKLSDALGQAILFKDLVSNIQQIIQKHKNQNGNQLIDKLQNSTECPACKIENETEERVLDSFKHGLRDRGFIEEYRRSDGLCFPHLLILLPKLDDKKKQIVLDYQKHRLNDLEMELSEFIRKSDYRFHDEIIGKEGDSYKRAADLVHGKRKPAEKKDIR